MDSHQWIVIADGETRIGREAKKVFEGASLRNPVHLIHNVDELFSYLQGHGIYANRDKFPLPLVLMVDMALLSPGVAERLGRIRACDGIGDVPIIVLIDPGQETELDVAYEAGATTYLQKPFTFADFVERSRLADMHFLILGGLP